MKRILRITIDALYLAVAQVGAWVVGEKLD